MQNDKIMLWLHLCVDTGITRSKLLALYRYFGSVSSIYSAQAEMLLSVSDITPKQAQKITEPDFSKTKEHMNRLKNMGVHVLTIECTQYPELLRHISTPPLVLYCRGKLLDLNKFLCVGCVGSRNPSPYGKKHTYNIVKNLCESGVLVVSGMAQGIDAVAHSAAIESGLPTVAFIASGVDIIYPKINSEINNKILKNGMIVSEYPLGTRPVNYYFPERNRLIAGVSKGVLITEAKLKSGSSLTISYALEQNKDIFALPGNVDSPLSEEPNRLIKLGAYAVSCAKDILRHYSGLYAENMSYAISQRRAGEEILTVQKEESSINNRPAINANMSDEEKILSVLKSESLDIDSLSALTSIELSSLNMTLLMMEMEGKIKIDNGIYFSV